MPRTVSQTPTLTTPPTPTATTTPSTTRSPFHLLSHLSSFFPTLLLLFFLTTTPLLSPPTLLPISSSKSSSSSSSSSQMLCHAMDIEKFCQARCYYGKGGNLCNCNAFHFAGKRGSSSLSSVGEGDEEEAFQLGSRPLLELALADIEEAEKQAEAEEKHLDSRGGRVPRPAALDVLQEIPLASLSEANSRGEGTRTLQRGGGNGGASSSSSSAAATSAAGARGSRSGLFDVSQPRAAEEDVESVAEGDRERAAVNRLSSLIKTALDERLIDRYEGSRKRKQSHLPFEEREFVF